MRRLIASAPEAIEESALIGALIEALPQERPRRVRAPRLPAWAHPPAARAAQAPLLAALARLPRRQRLALGLMLLRAIEPAQAAALLGTDEETAHGIVRDALLALAPQAAPDLAPSDLESANAPEACRPPRAALALGGATLHSDPAIRGHLALCASCRTAEQAWLRITAAVEEALRGALRDIRLPGDLAE